VSDQISELEELAAIRTGPFVRLSITVDESPASDAPVSAKVESRVLSLGQTLPAGFPERFNEPAQQAFANLFGAAAAQMFLEHFKESE
jgi:hypothetical protein